MHARYPLIHKKNKGCGRMCITPYGLKQVLYIKFQQAGEYFGFD